MHASSLMREAKYQTEVAASDTPTSDLKRYEVDTYEKMEVDAKFNEQEERRGSAINEGRKMASDEGLQSSQQTFVPPLTASELLRSNSTVQKNSRPHFVPKLEPLSRKVEELRQKMDEVR